MALVILCLGYTYRFKVTGNIPTEKVIYTIWHRNMIPLIFRHRFLQIAVLISASRDGSLISNPMEVLGYKIVRGSSSVKNKSALRQLISASQKYSLALTPDGPKGPPYKIKDGVLFISYMTKNPLVPVKIDVESEWVFNSWDKFRIPKPFSKIRVKYFAPIPVNSREEFPEIKKMIDNLMGNE